jgi:hypothetical protein
MSTSNKKIYFDVFNNDYLSSSTLNHKNMTSPIANQLFNALGLTKDWTSLDVIDKGCSFILANEALLREKLNKTIVGDLSLLRSETPMVRRKSLLAFARRVAASEQAAIIRKRKQVRTGKKTVSQYSYKLITA